MARWLLVGLCAVSACGRINYDPLAHADAGDRIDARTDAGRGDAGADAALDASTGDGAVPCTTFGPWGPPSRLPEFVGAPDEYDPAQRGDRLQIWYADPDTGSLWTARRESTADPYGAPVEETVNGEPGGDQDPTPTADGLVLLWASNRDGTYRIYEARRASPDVDFEPPALARGLESYTSNSVDVLPNGLTLYFNLFGELQRTTRADRDSPFDPPVAIGVTAAFPTLSSDELEIYYVAVDDPVVRTRVSPVAAFGPEMAIPGFCMACGDPDISADGTELIVNTRTQDVLRSVRSCE